MPEYLTQKEAFGKCKREGKFIIIEQVDEDKIKATLAIAEGDVESAEIIKERHKLLWRSGGFRRLDLGLEASCFLNFVNNCCNSI